MENKKESFEADILYCTGSYQQYQISNGDTATGEGMAIRKHSDTMLEIIDFERKTEVWFQSGEDILSLKELLNKLF